MTPQQFTAELASAARKAIRATVKTVNPILSAILAVLNSETDSYHRHADLCPCTESETHAPECPIAIFGILSEEQQQRLYRFMVHVVDPACSQCEHDNGLARTYDAPKRGGLRMVELELD
jgi:hypothetical protein